MNKRLIFLSFIFIFFQYSCDRYELQKPGPTTITHFEPGVMEFSVRQFTRGIGTELKVDSMNIRLMNQSTKSVRWVSYSIRAFKHDEKDFSNLEYWVNGFHRKLINEKDTAIDSMSNAISEIISYDNLEIDLISYITIDGEEKYIKTPFSGQYRGTYTVEKDSVIIDYGQHLTWIDYKGKLISYLDHGSYPWISITGQIIPNDNLYGQVNYKDTSLRFDAKILDNNNSININFKLDTTKNYHFNLILD